MIEELNRLDIELFLKLNQVHSAFFDSFFSFYTNKFTWIPLYIVIIFFLYKKYGGQGFYSKLIYILISVGASDFIVSGILKPYFSRPRPCHNKDISDIVHLVVNCGGSYGFASSHASTAFALAISCSLLFKNLRVASWFLFYAVLMAYSRIYVGVHYPLDVLTGALIGIALAAIFYPLSKIEFKKL